MATPKHPPKILCVVGARPNFMKIAPIIAAFRQHEDALAPVLVHTGQHYDAAMNDSFFEDLGIPRPDINLEVGSSSHAVQTAEIMRRFEPVLHEQRPAAVLVVGDVNSTIACALVAAKENVRIVHVEAGLRSFDRAMPEEINRVLTDQISDLLFTTERHARDNLLREGVAEERIHFVGNVMIDSVRHNLARAVPVAETLSGAIGPAFTGLQENSAYAVLTMHRPSNVDDANVLRGLLETLREIAGHLAVVFPMHPRTRARIEAFGLQPLLDHPGLLIIPPVGYLQMLGLVRDARLVLTDSGGLQEETTALGVPCLTLRSNTERPITIDEGTNVLVGGDPAQILAAFHDIMQTGGKSGRIPEYWDGHAADRIVATLRSWI